MTDKKQAFPLSRDLNLSSPQILLSCQLLPSKADFSNLLLLNS